VGVNETQLESWLKAYGGAWEARDGEAAAGLFSEDATYQWEPYDEPFRGRAEIRDRWNQATADQDQVRFGFEIVAAPEEVAVVEWWCTFLLPKQESWMDLRGIFLLRFDEDGLCTELREWWNPRQRPTAS
jgi:SnoaL-like domain